MDDVEFNFPSLYQEFIYKRTYSRYLDDLGRRESWGETVGRYAEFFDDKVPTPLKLKFKDVIAHIETLDVMPSMRALWSAGEALKRDNIAGYNCAYTAVNKIKKFAEILHILMCGTGVGVSVERQEVAKLPCVPETITYNPKPIVFADSKKGWADGFYKFIFSLFNGAERPCDLSKIRPKGARLKTFGGRASGPAPLQKLLDYTRQVIFDSRGRNLNSLECYDLCCYIADIVVVGGVRRAAILSLSNLSDLRMAEAKTGQFPEIRYGSNNSVAYTEKPNTGRFIQEWLTLIKSRSGERGIFNREGAKKIVGGIGRRDPNYDFGCNPCSEIILRPDEFCNLTEVVVKAGDSAKELMKKVEYATILGCLQSTLTDFRFLGAEWKRNCEEERLLGVSLTGLRDHGTLGHTNKAARTALRMLKQVAINTAEIWSKALGIPMPTAITCVKPSGTVSQLVNSSSGLHPRFSPHQIKRVRVNRTDPLAQMLIDKGLNWNPENGQNVDNCTTVVFEFPLKAPDNAVCVEDTNAIEQLEYWTMLQECWCEHKPSCTVYVKEHEWLEVGTWVYKNWDIVSGISFFPVDGSVYQLPPNEIIDENKFNELESAFPVIDFSELDQYEKNDNTTGAREYACAGGACEI